MREDTCMQTTFTTPEGKMPLTRPQPRQKWKWSFKTYHVWMWPGFIWLKT